MDNTPYKLTCPCDWFCFCEARVNLKVMPARTNSYVGFFYGEFSTSAYSYSSTFCENFYSVSTSLFGIPYQQGMAGTQTKNSLILPYVGIQNYGNFFAILVVFASSLVVLHLETMAMPLP